MKNLEKTNPAERWLEVRMTAEIRLATGHRILVRFDVPSSIGAKKVVFTGGSVWKHWSQAMLGEDSDAPAHSLRLDDTAKASVDLADRINEVLTSQGQDLVSHAALSFSILDALKDKQWGIARHCLTLLAKALLSYEPQATDIGWGSWLVDCTDYLEFNKEH